VSWRDSIHGVGVCGIISAKVGWKLGRPAAWRRDLNGTNDCDRDRAFGC
jgi:hypothetical protein